MEMHTGMGQGAKQAMGEGLLRLLADTYAVYLKTQNFHWNLTCQNFQALHLLFEKQYEELADATDEIAERIRALGFFVDASFSAFKKMSSITDESRVLTSKEMLEHLIKGHESVIRLARHLTEEAEKEKDFGSIDLLGRRLIAHEKMAWMLRSSL